MAPEAVALVEVKVEAEQEADWGETDLVEGSEAVQEEVGAVAVRMEATAVVAVRAAEMAHIH
jgi:hypothetical protein